MNVEKATLDKILANEEIRSLFTAIGNWFWWRFLIYRKLVTKKLVIMTDADVDGSHIRTLLITLFYRYMRPAVEAGYIYIAQPPLYKLKQGKMNTTFKMIKSLKRKTKRITSTSKTTIITIQRSWEMDAEQLWETTMNPENRSMLQVSVEDAAEAGSNFRYLDG